MSIPVDQTLNLQGAGTVTGLQPPVNATDAATKAYADAIAQGTIYDDAVQSVATANVTLSSPGAIGVATTGQRVLLTAQTTGSQNGIWVFNGNASALTRPTSANPAIDFSTNSTKQPGTATFDENLKTLWVMNNTTPVTVDTTASTWTSIGTAVAYTAGAGLSLSGNTFSIENGGVLTIPHGGTGASTAAGALNNLGAIGKYATTIGDGTTTTFSVNHGRGTGDVIVQVYDMNTGAQELVQATIVDSNHVSLTFATPPANSAGNSTTIPGAGGNGKRVVVTG